MEKIASHTAALSGFRPEQRGNHHGAEQQHPAHRRCPAFSSMQVGKLAHFLLGADRLPDFERDQFPDDEITEQEAEQERSDAAPTARKVR
jgi:hypothetical protein